MKFRLNHIVRIVLALVATTMFVQEAVAQLPVRTRDVQLISNNNVNVTHLQAVNGQVADWTFLYPPTAGATGSLLTSTVAGTTATMNWLTPTTNGFILSLSAGAPTWTDASGLFWGTLGNTGTNAATNFLGTTDAQPLVIKTNNTEAVRILTNGNVGVGTATPTQLLEVEDGNVLISTSGAGLAGTLRMEEDAANGNNYVGFVAPSSLAADNTYTLPTGYPAANNYVLTSTTAGVTAWQDPNVLVNPAWLLAGNANAIATNFVGPTSAGIPLNLATANAAPGNIMFYVGTVAAANERMSLTNTRLNVGTAATPIGLTVFGTAGTPNVRIGSIGGVANVALPVGFDRVLIADVNGDVSQASYAAVVNTTAWTLTGNSGTNPATNFLGTIDAQPLVIRTGNTEAVRILTSGNVGIGTNAPSQLLEVEDGNVLISTSGAGTAGSIRMEEDAANGNNYVGFHAAANMVADNPYTLPSAYPAVNNYVLTSTTAGVMNWADANTLITNAWLITGNTGTSAYPVGASNFIGTTDAQDFVIKTNNVFRARLVGGAVNTGNLVLGTTTGSPANSTAAQATDKLTILGGDLSFDSENSAAITRQILFRGTAGNGNFRISGDGGDIFWQGGGGNMLQMGSYWGMRFYGNQAAAGIPAFVGGGATDPTLNLIVTRTGSPGLAITRSAGMTANQTEWRTSAGAVLSMMSPDANLGLGVTTNTVSKLRINASLTTGNAIQIDPWGVAAGNTGEERFLELAAGGANYVAFKAPDALAADNTYLLPNAYPAANNYVLVSTTAGTMSWADPGSLISAWMLTGNANAIATSFLGPTSAAMPLNLSTSNAVPGNIMFYIGPVGAAQERASITNTRFFVGSAVTNTGLTVYGAAGTPNVRLGSISGAAAGAIPVGFDRVLIGDNNGDVSQVSYSGLINASAWTLLGNSGTNVATNFLGTTDNQAFAIRTNNVEAVRILTNGNVGIGTSAPSALLEVEDGSIWISTSAAGTPGQLKFEESGVNGTSGILFQAPTALAADMTYTLPTIVGTANQFLRINPVPAPNAGAATLEWATVTVTPSVEQFVVIIDNQAIAQAGTTTYMRLLPDAIANNRTTTIANGVTDGQVLVIRVVAAGANGVEFIDGGNMTLSGNFNMNNTDTMTLIWDGVINQWVETARRNN